MSDGSLSQEEIDALLQGVDEMAPESAAPTSTGAGVSALTEAEKSAFLEIINQQLTNASNTLSTIVTKKVEMSGPHLDVKSPVDVRSELAGEYLQIRIDYTEGISGESLYLMKKEDGSVIADLMMGQEGTSPPAELNDLYLSALGEAVSQINSASLNVISEKIKKAIKTTPPKVEIVSEPAKVMLPTGDQVVRITSSLSIEGLVSSNLVQVYPITFIKEVIASGAPSPVSYEMNQQTQAPAVQPSAPASGQVKVQQVQFPPLNVQGVSPEQAANIQLLMDVPMHLTVELGRTRMLVKEILGLGEGSIIELDKLAGEPVDLLVNNKLIAKGEVVVIDENFGVRVTDIINPVDRLVGLQEK